MILVHFKKNYNVFTYQYIFLMNLFVSIMPNYVSFLFKITIFESVRHLCSLAGGRKIKKIKGIKGRIN